jgi:hypothetical protein
MSHPPPSCPGIYPQGIHRHPMGLNQQWPPQFQKQPGKAQKTNKFIQSTYILLPINKYLKIIQFIDIY